MDPTVLIFTIGALSPPAHLQNGPALQASRVDLNDAMKIGVASGSGFTVVGGTNRI